MIKLNKQINQIIIPELSTHTEFDTQGNPIYRSSQATSANYRKLTYELLGESGGNYTVVLPDQYERSLWIRPSRENDEHWGFQLDNRASATRIQLRNEKLSKFFDGMGDTIHPDTLQKRVAELLLSPEQITEWLNSRVYRDNRKSGLGWTGTSGQYFNKKDIEMVFIPLFNNYVDIANQADIAASKTALIYRLDNLSVNATNTQVFIGKQTIHYDYQLAENMHLRFKLPGMEGVSFNLTGVKSADNATQIKFSTNLVLSEIKNLDGNNLKEITAFVNGHLSDTKRFTDPRFVQLHTKIGDVDVVGLIDFFMITTNSDEKNRPVGRFIVNAKSQSINVTQLHWKSQDAVFEYNRSASNGSSSLSVTLPAGKKTFDLSALNFNSTYINSMCNLTIIVDKDTHSLTLDHKLINQLKPQKRWL